MNKNSNIEDPFLNKVYYSINDSKMQKKIREIKPFPVDVVFWQQRGQTIEDIRNNFRKIKELGFTGLKQICLQPNSNIATEEVELIALEEGLVPWFYGEAGWDPISDELLDGLNISKDLSIEEIESHPSMLQHQLTYYKKRILMEKLRPKENYIAMGEPGRTMLPIPERLLPCFADWLEKQYKTLDNLKSSWNVDAFSDPTITSFDEAARVAGGNNDTKNKCLGFSDFRRYRDAMKFQADLQATDINQIIKSRLYFDCEEPQRTGGHMLFQNQALNGWNLETQAQSIRNGGSFYSSIHLVHHFSEVDGEVDRPVYMQSRMIHDFFKGGWSATWESTGGPAIYSGQKSAGVDGGTITRLMLSYIAAGLKGIGLWTWNSRDVGWEMGEYGLLDLTGEPSDRAIAAGCIAKAIQKYRFELWQSCNRPMVGILYSWDNEAIFARLSMGGYPIKRLEEVPLYPSYARIGASRAFINHNIPFEYVTQNDLEHGLAGRYNIIFLPHILCMSQKTLKILYNYIENGGRVVADMPFSMMDEYGRLMNTKKGSIFEKIFGFSIADFQHTNTITMEFNSKKVEGQFGDIKLTNSQIISKFSNGKPAIVENKLGLGSVSFINFEISSMCHKPGYSWMEDTLVKTALGENLPEWTCDTQMTYCLSSPNSDHYFFINDGEKRYATITNASVSYTSYIDAITGDSLSTIKDNHIQVEVPSFSGRWVRASKELLNDEI